MKHRVLFATLALLSLAGCGSTSDSDADDTANTDLAASAAEVGDVAGAGSTGIGRFLESRTSCSGISFGSCASGVRERDFSSASDGYCTRGSSNGRHVYGKSILTFANVGGACDFDSATGADTNSPSVTRTLDNHYVQRGNNGRKVLVYTGEGTVADKTIAAADLTDFEGTVRSGGAVLKKLSGGTKKLTILGIHRRGLNPNGKFTHWHTLYSDADGITVTNSGSDRVLNGTMYIMHNRKSLKITKTMTNVTFSSSCQFPKSGTTTFSWTEEGAAQSVSVTWSSTCGEASIDGTNEDLDSATAG
jgi:hypothetical protein